MADEYIRKQDAMQIAFKSPFFSDALMEEIKSLPSADVVPVVRCKYCRYRVNSDKCCHPDGMLRSKDSDFCSYGERRSEQDGRSKS